LVKTSKHIKICSICASSTDVVDVDKLERIRINAMMESAKCSYQIDELISVTFELRVKKREFKAIEKEIIAI